MGYTRKLYSPQDIHILNTFFEQMNADCNLNMSQVIWEWEKDLPCFEMFQHGEECYRRRGLGSACLFYSIQILKSWGCKTVFAEPDEEAYEYYRKIGFKKDLWYAYFSR